MKAVKRNLHVLDAKGEVLGRLATKVALLLYGKNKPSFERHLDTGDSVEVFNLKHMKITGNKLEQKVYYKHSGYPGGLKETKLKDVMEKDPGDALVRAVYGMLPKNKLRPGMIKRLITHNEEKKS